MIFSFALLMLVVGLSCQFLSGIEPTSEPESVPIPWDEEEWQLKFLPDQLPDAEQGTPYHIEIRVENVDTFVGEFIVAEGMLPPGLNIERVSGENAAIILGVPTESGSYTFILDVWCYGTNDPGQTGHKEYKIYVNDR
jgi:hypothetical protein